MNFKIKNYLRLFTKKNPLIYITNIIIFGILICYIHFQMHGRDFITVYTTISLAFKSISATYKA